MTYQTDLFVPASGGGFHSPTVEPPPGVFVEPCKLFERSPHLEPAEIPELWSAWKRCGWHGIGFEAGRDFERVSFRADFRDGEVMFPQNWYVGEAGVRCRLGGLVFREPGETPKVFPPTYVEENALRLRPWAVEFPKTDRGDGRPGFVRRRFWFASRYRVPDLPDGAERERRRRQAREAKRTKVVRALALLLAFNRWRLAAKGYVS